MALKMKTTEIPLSEVRQKAIHILMDELGPVDTVRFFQQFDLGEGDYTKERTTKTKNKSVNELSQEILKFQKKK